MRIGTAFMRTTLLAATRDMRAGAAGLALAAVAFAPAAKAQSANPLGGMPDARYRNLFCEQLGRSEGELDAELSAWWQQLFYGDDATQRVYYPLADGTAYVTDVANADARTEGLHRRTSPRSSSTRIREARRASSATR